LRREIKERKQAEGALRISERKYSTLVENSLTGIFLVQDGKFVFTNQKFAEILGYEREELLGMDSLKLAHPEERESIRDIREKRIRGEEAPAEYETRVLKKDGETIWIRRRATSSEYNGKPAVLGTIVDITERKHVEEELRTSEKELRSLSSKLLNAQEEERKRIAWELHDTTAQNLVSIQLALGQKLDQMGEAKAPAGISLENILAMVQDSISEVRRIMAALRPSILDDLGIRSTIDWHCREFQKIHPQIELKKLILVQEKEIPQALKIVIFRILQEALHNVAKHSHASFVDITLQKAGETLELTIADNGGGFDKDAVRMTEERSWGMGLSSMKERTELSGGTFEIESASGNGTKVQASWPV
jgi:PAS domain S-box-containing protein